MVTGLFRLNTIASLRPFFMVTNFAHIFDIDGRLLRDEDWPVPWRIDDDDLGGCRIDTAPSMVSRGEKSDRRW